MELRDFAPQVFKLHGAGDFEGARRRVVEALPHLTDNDTEIATFWKACLDACTGHGDDALDTLEAALDRGWWYGPRMLSDEDLDSIREEPRFGAILERSEEAQTAARRAPPVPIVSEPEGDLRGAVVAIHAAEGRTTHTSHIWGTARNRGYRIIAVASSLKVTSLRATWDDRSRALADVTTQLDTAVEPLIMGGRSLGAAVALHLATIGAIRAAGLILVAPTLRWELARPALPFPVVILAGERDSDRLRSAAADIEAFLTDAGCRVDHQVVAGMGHYYPDDFDTWLISSIDWIESETRA